jgi:hypothetical protein
MPLRTGTARQRLLEQVVMMLRAMLMGDGTEAKHAVDLRPACADANLVSSGGHGRVVSANTADPRSEREGLPAWTR